MSNTSIIDLLSIVRDRLHSEMVRELSARGYSSLAPSHTMLLMRLQGQDGQTMMALADQIGRDKSTVTALVKKLLALSLVRTEKDVQDQRVTRVFLTDAGRSLRTDLDAATHKLTSQIFQGFNWEDRKSLSHLLERILENL